MGGGFVGAAPQLTYRPLLEAMAARGALVSLGSVVAGRECVTSCPGAGCLLFSSGAFVESPCKLSTPP
jgi:hypothetical protein